MISDPFLRWMVTAGFVVTTVFWTVRSVARTVPVSGRIASAWHAVMSLAMLTMVWSGLPGLSTAVGMTVFAGAAVAFVVLLAMRREHRVQNSYHVLMMATMVWMYAVMDSSIVGGTQRSSGGGSMDMGGGTVMSMPSTMTMHLPPWAGHIDLAIGLVYLVLAATWVAHSNRGTFVHEHSHRINGGMQAVMAAATALMFLSNTG